MSINFDFLSSKVNIDIIRFLADKEGKFNKEEDKKDITLAKHIVQETGYSRKGIYDALKKLSEKKMVKYMQVGKSKVYSINSDHPVIKQFKVLKAVIELHPLIDRICEFSKKIILYGSTSRGEDIAESDIDLAVISENIEHEDVRQIINKFKSKRKINAEIISPFNFEGLKRKNQVYYLEIDRGIILWEEKGE